MKRAGALLFLAVVFAGASLAVLLFRDAVVERLERFGAGVFFVDSITERDLEENYVRAGENRGKIRVFLVPGHDDTAPGTLYRGMREADLTLEIAGYLAEFLRVDPHFNVFVARDREGYNQALVNYFTSDRAGIEAFRSRFKGIMRAAVDAGVIGAETQVNNGVANEETAIKLYGMSRWANRNNIHIALHLHFNNYPRRNQSSVPGDYSGFALYVPERQLSNAKASRAIAEDIRSALRGIIPVSDLPQEEAGITESQELIALGAANTLDAAGVLVEYGYIYEPQFTDPDVRPLALRELAYQTYLGLQSFFEDTGTPAAKTPLIPYSWGVDVSFGARGSPDIFALQSLLRTNGFYPPRGETFRTCPMTGNFLSCTLRALVAFQTNAGLPPNGMLDAPTRELLNRAEFK